MTVDTLSGHTEIDTLYELKGFELALRFHDALFVTLVVVCAGFGLLTALYRASDENKWRRLVLCLAQIVIVLFFLQKVDVKVAVPGGFASAGRADEMILLAHARGYAQPTIKAPRLLVWTHFAIDRLTRALVGSVNASFTKEPFGTERTAVLLGKSRISDTILRDRYHAFVISCYVPLLAHRSQKGQPAPDPHYDPFKAQRGELLPYSVEVVSEEDLARTAHVNYQDMPKTVVACADEQPKLYAALHSHVTTHATHREIARIIHDVLRAHGKADFGDGQTGHSTVFDVQLRYVLYNETQGLLASNEIRTLMAAVPEYEMFNRAQQTNGNGQDFIGQVRTVLSWLIKIRQSVDQWIDHHAEGPALYYKVVCYSPYVAGLASMIIIALFPIAGFIALMPGYWTSVLTWAKHLLWVKLWMVFWSVLAGFNEWRYGLGDIGSDPSNGIGDQTYIFPAIALMYLGTPLLSLLAVKLLSAGAQGASNAIGSLVGNSGAHGFDAVAAGQRALGGHVMNAARSVFSPREGGAQDAASAGETGADASAGSGGAASPPPAAA